VHHHGTKTGGYGGAREDGSIGGGDGLGGESFTSRSAADETHGTNESAQGGVSNGAAAGGGNRDAGAAAVGGAISELRANDERGAGEVELEVSERRGELGDCWITGPCVLCGRDELLLEYCRDTGRRQEVRGVRVGSVNEGGKGGGAVGRPKELRAVTQDAVSFKPPNRPLLPPQCPRQQTVSRSTRINQRRHCRHIAAHPALAPPFPSPA